MSISEAAIVFGASTHSIRQQAQSGRLESREENDTLYVRVPEGQGDPTSLAASRRGTDDVAGPERQQQRRRVWRGLITGVCVIALGVVAGGVGYRVLELRHKREMKGILNANTQANRDLARQLEDQRIQSISLARDLHDERANLKHSTQRVESLSAQVDAASSRLEELEQRLARETSQREALLSQRVELIEERDRLTQDLAEMMKHLTVARKQLLETKAELSETRSRIAHLEPHPQASPLPREMLEDLGEAPTSTPPKQGRIKQDSSTVASSQSPPTSERHRRESQLVPIVPPTSR